MQDPHVYLLRQWTDDLILFTHTHAITDNERLARDARGIAVVDGQVQYLIVADDRLSGVQLADGRTVPRVALFIRPAPRAHRDGLAATLGCETLAEGLLRTDGNGRSSVPGVWAAGNATNPRAQVITAAAEGSAVAVAINTELVNNDLDTATRHAAAPPAP